MSIPAKVHYLRKLFDKHFIPTINASPAESTHTQELRIFVPDGQRFRLGAVILVDGTYYHITRLGVSGYTKHREPLEVLEEIQSLQGKI